MAEEGDGNVGGWVGGTYTVPKSPPLTLNPKVTLEGWPEFPGCFFRGAWGLGDRETLHGRFSKIK